MAGGKGGGSSSTVTVNNGPVHVDADSTVELQGLDNIKVTLQPSPLKTEAKTELILPQPLKTDSNVTSDSNVKSDSKSALAVDLKPVAVDMCLNTSTKLPNGQIHQPYSLHVGFTLFGMELFGFKLGGEARTVLQDLPKRPAMDWPAQHNSHGESAGRGTEPHVVEAERGLRIRVK